MEALDFFTNQFGFLTPLLLPWLQKLCRDSAEEQLRVLFETELATPLQLLSCSNFSYRYIRLNIIPRLISFIESIEIGSDIYFRNKLYKFFYIQIQEEEDAEKKEKDIALGTKLQSNKIDRNELNNIELNGRIFELLLNDILTDLFFNFNAYNILPIERMQIIQYIRCLIYECEKNIKQNKSEINLQKYSGLICCNLLSILNDEYAAECVCDSEDTNLSNFKVFTDIINENNVQFPILKNEKENIEIHNEKLQRKLKQQQQNMANNNNNGPSMQSMHTPYLSHNQNSAEAMRQIPHTPHISGMYNDQLNDWKIDGVDPENDMNQKQILRGQMYKIDMIQEDHEEDTIDSQLKLKVSTPRRQTVSFAPTINTANSQPPPPPPPPHLGTKKSQSVDINNTVNTPQLFSQVPPPRSAQSAAYNNNNFPYSNNSNAAAEVRPLKRQNSHPHPAQQQSVERIHLPPAPPPPIEISTQQKSLPITMHKNYNSTQSYDSTKNVNIDTPLINVTTPYGYNFNQSTRIQPPAITTFETPNELATGLTKTQFFAKYLIDSKIIGQGSFAVVRRCKRVTDERILAMKIIKKKNIDEDADMELIRREITILIELDHPNVIRVYDWCETNSRLFIVLDYCGGGNVLDRIIKKGSFSEFETAQLIRELAITIQYYHSKGVVHRDLKPENIMYLDDNYSQMKLIDFGMANTLKNVKGRELTTACGSPLYAAPEILNNEKYGTAVDVWSMGVITYLLLCGFPPFFDTQNIKNVYALIRKAKFSFPSPFWDPISENAKDFIVMCLELDVDKRYTAQNVLNHAWIAGSNKEDDFLYDDTETDTNALPDFDDSSSTDDDFAIDEDDDDINYDLILAKDNDMIADFNVNPLHAVKTPRKKQRVSNISTGIGDGGAGDIDYGKFKLKRAPTEPVLKHLKRTSLEPVLKGKYTGHGRKSSLLYMNQGTIFSAQRDHLQKQKTLIEQEREELTAETKKLEQQRQDLLQLLDEHNEFKKTMTTFEQQKAIFTQEKNKWLAVKGSVEEEKKRLQTLQLSMTERYEAEFDKFVNETQEQRLQLQEEYKKLNDERLEFKQKNGELAQELETLHAERVQFETDRNNSLPTDIQKLRQDLEGEWLKIASTQKQHESEAKSHAQTSVKLKKMMNTMSRKEREIEQDHKELLEIKQKIFDLQEEKKAELELVKSDKFHTVQKAQIIQQQREMDKLRSELEAEKAEFYAENVGDEGDWKQKYFVMKQDFDNYCDEMDEYCDTLEGQKKEAEDKYHDLYASFDSENTQLTHHIQTKNDELAKQEERLRELEEAEEMWQHHVEESAGLKKEMDEKQRKFERISDEMGQLHQQIANYKAQLVHFVEMETELDELKKQMLSIQEQGGTAGISIIREEYGSVSDVDDAFYATRDLTVNADANIVLSEDEDLDAIANIKVGDRVELQKGWVGRIQYIGSVPPIKHEVIGLALDEAIADGHDGKGLFVCKPKHGYFTQRWRIKRVIHVSTPRKSPIGGRHVQDKSAGHYGTIRIKITNIDEMAALVEEAAYDGGNEADIEEEEELVMVNYGTLPGAAPVQTTHVRQYKYIEPHVPAQLNNEQLGWIFHRLRETPIGPLDVSGDNKINLQEFVAYFVEMVKAGLDYNDIDDSVYSYAFALIDINGDGDITPLEYYRFFDKYRLFPHDHFVNGTVEYQVLCIKSYGLSAQPVNSKIFNDGDVVFFHQSQFKHLVPWRKLQDRDDTSDEEEFVNNYDPKIQFKSKTDLNTVSNVQSEVVQPHKMSLSLVDDETESLYDYEAEQSALRALDGVSEAGDDDEEEEEEEEDDAVPVPHDSDTSSSDSSEQEDADSFEGGLFDAYVVSGKAPRSPNPAKSPTANHPFPAFENVLSNTSMPGARAHSVNKPKVEENISVEDAMKELSQSRAQLNLQKVGLEMVEQQRVKEQAVLQQEKLLIAQEKERLQKLRENLENKLQNVGKSAPVPAPERIRMDGSYSVEYEEDVISLGTNTMSHTGSNWMTPLQTADNSANIEDTDIQILNDKIIRLQQLLLANNINIPGDLVSTSTMLPVIKSGGILIINEEEYEDEEFEAKKDRMENKQEQEDRLREERKAKIKLAKINSKNMGINHSEYSFGIQLFYEEYDFDKFGCITFEGFFEALKVLELDDTAEYELRAIFYYADTDGNNGLDIDEFLYALCVQFLNSILDRKLRLTFGQCDDDFNGALDKEEMRNALEILNVNMTEKHYNSMFDKAEDAGVKALEDDYSQINLLVHDNSSGGTDSDSDSDSEEGVGMVCDFVHFKSGLLTAQPFAFGEVELSHEISDYAQNSPVHYVGSLLSLCWHILMQSFKLMDEDNDGLLNCTETANVTEYLGITNKPYGDIQTLRGVYNKITAANGDGDHTDFRMFVQIMLQQYFRGISDQTVRCIFDSHCQGLMSFEQFVNSFEAIKANLPSTRGDDNFKHLKYKNGTTALLKLFKNNDRHNGGMIEWDKYSVCIRECINFHLEDMVNYEKIFKDDWNKQHEEETKEDIAVDIVIDLGNINYEKLIENALQKEFNKYDSVSVEDIIEMSEKYKWDIHGFAENKEIYKWWITAQIMDGDTDVINWEMFKRIVYNIWYYSYFETSIKKQFKQCVPSYNDEDGITLQELSEFVTNMNFGLNDALIRSEEKMLKLCYYKVDVNRSGVIDYDEMVTVLQHIYLYSMSEYILLRYKYDLHSIIDSNQEKYLQKEDFLTMSKNNMLIFSNDEEKDDINDSLMMIKICNSSSFLSGLFDKFGCIQYRGDTTKKMTFDNFTTAYFYRLLMELCCFYIDDICQLSFDEQDEKMTKKAEYDDYIKVFETLGFNIDNNLLFSKKQCDSLAMCMFNTRKLSLKQFYVFLMNKAMINNLELQIYGSFKEYCGDHRDYINTNECVRLVKYLKNNQIIHGKMYSLQKYISDYLKFWNNHYQPVIFKDKIEKIRRRNDMMNTDNDNEDKWRFESFLHCLTFHQFQLNHGRSHLLLKAMNLDRQKMKILKLKETNIKNERMLLNKEKKLHDFYVKLINQMKKNEKKLIVCKNHIENETNNIKKNLNIKTAASENNLLAIPDPNRESKKQRTSAIQIAKQRVASRRGSVVIKTPRGLSTNYDDSKDNDDYPRQSSHFANQISVELQIGANDDELPENFNPFGNQEDDNDTSADDEESSLRYFNPEDIDIDIQI